MCEKIFLDYDQRQLNEQYDQTTLVPNPGDYIELWLKQTELAKSEFPCKIDIAYGKKHVEKLDLFYPKDVSNYKLYPLLIFCHGGAWKALSKEHSGYLARVFVPQKIAFAALDFGLVPDFTLDQVVTQVRRASWYLYKNAQQFHIHPEKIFVMGHSSGAHLASNIAVTNWLEFGGPKNLIKGLTAISGPYNLEPVKLSARNEYLKLNESEVRKLSPINSINDYFPPAVISWGGGELDEFKRQGSQFLNFWERTGAVTKKVVLGGKNHFEMGSELANIEGRLFKAVLKQIKY